MVLFLPTWFPGPNALWDSEPKGSFHQCNSFRQVELIEMVIADADTQEHAHFLVKVAALVTILTVASLRGHEGFYLDIAAT
jgi:hypothetical protein